jgi:hypothetical protein
MFMKITFNTASTRPTVAFRTVKNGQVVISTKTGRVFQKIQACGDRNAVSLDKGLKATFEADEQVVLAPNANLNLGVDPVVVAR